MPQIIPAALTFALNALLNFHLPARVNEQPKYTGLTLEQVEASRKQHGQNLLKKQHSYRLLPVL